MFAEKLAKKSAHYQEYLLVLKQTKKGLRVLVLSSLTDL